MDTEDATYAVDEALAAHGLASHWVNNTRNTLRVTFEDGTVAIVTVEVQ